MNELLSAIADAENRTLQLNVKIEEALSLLRRGRTADCRMLLEAAIGLSPPGTIWIPEGHAS